MLIKYDKDYYRSWQAKYYKNRYRTIDNLKNFKGYYKRWFLIMSESSSSMFRNDIYQIVINKFNDDLHNHQNKKKISTLAKWMPRENSSLDKELNFVETITKKMYPGIPPGKARQFYRKNVVELSKKLNILETYMSQKNMSNINFKTIPDLAFKRNIKNFIKYPECMNRFLEEYYSRQIKKTSEKFIEELLDYSNKPVFEKGLLKNAFNLKKKKFHNKIDKLKIPKDCIPILDTSNSNIMHATFADELMMSLYFISESKKIVISSNSEPLCLEFDWKDEYDKILQQINKNYLDSDTIDFKTVLDKHSSRSIFVTFTDNIDYDIKYLDKKLFLLCSNRLNKHKLPKTYQNDYRSIFICFLILCMVYIIYIYL